MQKISFEYEVGGERTARTLVDWAEVGRYIRGVDAVDNRLKTFRKDRVVSYIGGAAELLMDPHPEPAVLVPVSRRSADDRPHIIFTGFARVQRAALEAKAAEAAMRVCATVTNSLMYLVAGPNAGPAKVERARERSAYILEEQHFHALLATGELPDDVDGSSTDC